MAFNYVTNYVTSRDPDPSCLGCRVTMLFTGTNGVKTWLVVTYIAGKSSHKRLHLVKAQHRRHLHSLGDYHCPWRAAWEDLVQNVTQWMADGERII
eukprot:14873038-Ditylum_brightwellii.AAC.1